MLEWGGERSLDKISGSQASDHNLQPNTSHNHIVCMCWYACMHAHVSKVERKSNNTPTTCTQVFSCSIPFTCFLNASHDSLSWFWKPLIGTLCNSGLYFVWRLIHRPVRWLSGWGCWFSNPMNQVWSRELTWLKEIINSCRLFSDHYKNMSPGVSGFIWIFVIQDAQRDGVCLYS